MPSSSHTPRHGGTRGARGHGPQRAVSFVRRPVVGSALAVGLLATVGATVATGEPSHVGEQVAVSAPSTPTADLAGAQLADTARVDDGRRDANTSRSASREKDRSEAKERAERRAAWKKDLKKIEARKEAAAREKREARTAAADRKEERAEQAEQAEWVAAVQQDPKPYAVEIMREHGFGDDQWGCLETLWTGESDWGWDATNSSSGAYGIPQSLPADKMASAGTDWKTNPVTQIEWGMGYIKDAYGSPCQALEHWQSQDPHWY